MPLQCSCYGSRQMHCFIFRYGGEAGGNEVKGRKEICYLIEA